MNPQTAYSQALLEEQSEDHDSDRLETETKLIDAEDTKPEEPEIKDDGLIAAQQSATRIPWMGLGALVLITILTCAAAGVVVASHQSPIDHWKIKGASIQPQVWLSILTTLMDALAVFAFVEGVTMLFWKVAGQGSTLQKLHNTYESQYILGSLKQLGRGKLSLTAVASVLCFVSALRGPLFQRASAVNSNFTHNITAQQNISLAQSIPPGFFWANSAVLSEPFQKVVDDDRANSPIRWSKASCSGSCSARLKGYGFTANCSTTTVSPDIAIRDYQSSTNGAGGDVPAFNVSAAIFGVTWSDGPPNSTTLSAVQDRMALERSRIDISSLYKTTPGCTVPLTVTTCSLNQAILEYNVAFQNSTVSLMASHWQDDKVLNLVKPWNNFDIFNSGENDPWGPAFTWVYLLRTLFNQEISVYPDGSGSAWDGVELEMNLARQFFATPNTRLSDVNCVNAVFNDPTQFILDRVRELAFRTAVTAANMTDMTTLFFNASLVGSGMEDIKNWTQLVPVIQQQSLVVYTISIPYLVCAIVASLLAVVAVIPLYGYAWGLGRPCSFNPLEIANAFDAPLLSGLNTGVTSEEVAQKTGSMRVRYVDLDNADEAVELVGRMTTLRKARFVLDKSL